MTFVLASAAIMLVPGPAMLFMIGLALNEGLYRAFAALPGLALGDGGLDFSITSWCRCYPASLSTTLHGIKTGWSSIPDLFGNTPLGVKSLWKNGRQGQPL